MKFNLAGALSKGLEKVANKVDTLPTPGQTLHNISDKLAAMNGEATAARLAELKTLRDEVNKAATTL